MLVALIESGTDADGFDTALLLLRDAVLTHARYEERYEFTQLRANVPAERSVRSPPPCGPPRLSRRPARTRAPSPPPPTSLAGPALAVIDRARDLIRDAVRRSNP